MEWFSPFTGGRHGIVHVFRLRVRARADDVLGGGVEDVELRTAPARMQATARQVM